MADTPCISPNMYTIIRGKTKKYCYKKYA